MGESTDKIADTETLETTALSSDHSAGDDTTDVAEMRRNIEATRDDLSQTIDALQERLNPETIKQQVTEATLGKAEELGRTALDQIKAKTAPVVRLVKSYPVPCAVAGVVALLIIRRILGGGSSPVYVDEIDVYEIDD